MSEAAREKVYVIYGVSKGLGKALVQEIAERPHTKVYGISRTQPTYLVDYPNVHWICTDLAQPAQATQQVKAIIGAQAVDGVLYTVGIWEYHAFSEEYSFEGCTTAELLTLVQTNISSCLLAMQSLSENIRQSENGKIILIGSTWGLDNHNGKEVAFSATKYALRGMVQALRENLREDRVAVSILNLGYLATEFEREVPVETVLEQTAGALIPLQDVLQAVNFILATSSATCVKEITMPAMLDKNV